MDRRPTQPDHEPRPQVTALPAVAPPLVAASFGSELAGSPAAVLLLLLGISTLLFAGIMLVRVRPYVGTGVVEQDEILEDAEAVDDKEEPDEDDQDLQIDDTAAAVPSRRAQTPAAVVPPQPTVPARRPRTNTDVLRIRFADIDDRHPDVWGIEAPFHVEVDLRTSAESSARDATIRLARSVHGKASPLGEAQTDHQGVARFTVQFDARGEQDLVAVRMEHGRPAGQVVRAIRIVDYRDEVVETFEDFKAWAIKHHDAVTEKHTAREFVDRFIDARPGTPSVPLDDIVLSYERANFSAHPIDRHHYLRFVDAFLELESSGALDAEGATAP